jgi:hypothetical protein
MTARAPSAEFRVHDQLECELHVLGRERLAIVPANVVTKADAPVQPVLGNAPVLLRRHFGSKIGPQHTVGIHPEKRVEDGEMNRVVGFDMRHQRIENGRLLRNADHDAALELLLGGLRKIRLTDQVGRYEAGNTARSHQTQSIAPRVNRFFHVICGHHVPLF